MKIVGLEGTLGPATLRGCPLLGGNLLLYVVSGLELHPLLGGCSSEESFIRGSMIDHYSTPTFQIMPTP